jgi:hypothetical protein
MSVELAPQYIAGLIDIGVIFKNFSIYSFIVILPWLLRLNNLTSKCSTLTSD